VSAQLKQAVQSEKTALRRRLRAARAALPADLRSAWSRAIAARVLGLQEWRQAEAVQLFIGGAAGEVETLGLARCCLAAGKRLICPRVAGAELELRRVRGLDDLERGAFGLLEPNPQRTERAAPAQVDLFLLPGLAFDRAGGRLGMGGGFYDRLLEGHPAPRAGLAFGLQLLNAVPVDARDAPMHRVITELQVIETDGEGCK